MQRFCVLLTESSETFFLMHSIQINYKEWTKTVTKKHKNQAKVRITVNNGTITEENDSSEQIIKI